MSPFGDHSLNNFWRRRDWPAPDARPAANALRAAAFSSGIYAGVPGLEGAAVLCAPAELRPFWLDDMFVRAICALFLLVELAISAGAQAGKRPRENAALVAAATISGNR